MAFLQNVPKINFLGKRRIAMVLSITLIIISLGSIATRGLNFGLDFTGGVAVEVRYPAAVELETVRTELAAAGFGDAVVQNFGTTQDVLVRMSPKKGDDAIANQGAQATLGDRIFAVLKAKSPDLEQRRIDNVGPQIGDELTEQGFLALLAALGCILIYVGLRFEFRFALGSVIALAHDVIIAIGVFSLTQHTFDLPVLAALLAIIGYSLNDTIVVFDRIRENFHRIRSDDTVEVMNISVNETLSRTIMTSVTTLLVLLCLYFLGGESINGFSMALIVGVVVGTYSSVYVASAAALALGVSRDDLLPPEKDEEGDEEVEVDENGYPIDPFSQSQP